MSIFDLIFPKACLNCRKEGSYICVSCLELLPELENVCIYCERASIDGMTHVRCKKKYGLDGLLSLWPYVGVIRKAILSLKYKYAVEIADEIVKHALSKFQNSEVFLPKKSCIIPIPLYWYRQNLRGFNQSELVGRVIAEKIGWSYKKDFLIRRKQKRSQVELSGKERRKNIKNVFSLNSDYQLDTYNFILFDDVFTTGSTLKEACKVLKRSGAKEVWGLTIAK